MTRQVAQVIENNFKQGLITEATGLNFPENACTETYDCIFNLDGSFERRLGLDFEGDYTTKTINRTDVVISTYLWKNVAGDGNTSLFVVQIGGTIYFYETSNASTSAGAIASTVSLSTYLASGAPTPDTLECQFSSGSKHLVVTHPYCDPFYVSYNTTTQTATATAITIQIRDFAGDASDANAVDTRPTATLAGLEAHHKYNLYNQGWNTANLTSWDTSQTTMPSNCDVMWAFKNSSDAFDMAVLANVIAGNTRAPRGHFILTLSNQDRDTAAGTSGATATTTSYFRPSTSAFFASRVFYSGISFVGFNSSIYFTQILTTDQYGYCYQNADPTAEDLHDLLPNDGGVITIPEAGTIIKLVAISGALVVFANNGVWLIMGSTGLGFTATDYSIQKISTINAISASSFVDVAGFPAWWNSEGIYILTPGGQTLSPPTIQSMTLKTIKTFYDAIPGPAKYTAKGVYHRISGVIQWLYRNTSAGTPTDTYTYDRVLNFNVNTGAFYPWILPSSDVTVNAITLLDGQLGTTVQYDINDDSSNLIIDDTSNQIISFSFAASGGGATPIFKYLVSYVNSGSYKFTFAEENNTNYTDWISYDQVGTSFDSYLVSGYKLHGKGLTKFQPVWLTLFSDTSEATSYKFQSIWDYANVSTTNRWSTQQTVSHTDTDYSTGMKRLKVRGHGRALQFKIQSITTHPFNLVGWTSLESSNSIP